MRETPVETGLEAIETPLAAEAPDAEAEPLPQATEAQVYQDAATLAQQLYAALVQQHGEVKLAKVVDNDMLQLLERYRATSSALVAVEYYSNAGTFFLEATLEGQAKTSLHKTVSQIKVLQKQGALPGLAQGMAWKGGYIRLSRTGARPVLLLPSEGGGE